MFNPQLFDTTTLGRNTVVFNEFGVIDLGPYTTDPGISVTNFVSFIEGMLTNAGYGSTFTDLMVDFPNASYMLGITTSANPAPNAWTSIADNGILGTNGVDVILDGEGNNIIDAGRGDDFVLVGYGDDVVAGGAGNDLIFSDMGNDTVDGGNGADRIYLFDGNDRAFGGNGADELYGENGNDELWGGRGRDHLDGGLGNDSLFGDAGRDRLFGGSGDDGLNGGNGRDYLHGGSGVDILTGGAGRDTFAFDLSDGDDVITDFNSRHDTIELGAALGVSSFLELQQIGSESGNDLVLEFANGDSLTLENTSWADVSANDFSFI